MTRPLFPDDPVIQALIEEADLKLTVTRWWDNDLGVNVLHVEEDQ